MSTGICRVSIFILLNNYRSIGPAFYALRTTFIALLLMALLRIKRAESLKEHSPDDFGRIIGLDRTPEVKALRRKLTCLAALGRAADSGIRDDKL